MSHYQNLQPRSISAIRVDEFYKKFQLTNASPLSNVGPEHLRFVLDGFGAAVALANIAPGLGRDDTLLKEIMLRKTVSPEHLVVETLALPRPPANTVITTRYDSLSESLVSQYWIQVGRSLGLGDEMPRELTLKTPYRTRLTTGEIDIKYRCPIPLAFTPHSSNLASYGNLPQSAIFFASQFRRLRELSTKYKLAIRGRQAGPQRAFGRRDEQDLLHQIYQVLLSSALYMAIMLGWKDGVEKLGFGAEEWIVTYETGEQQDSEMFGVREGLELNGSFLLGHLEEFKLWEKAGPLWWCPGQDQGDMRHRLETALGDMQAQLLDIYEEIYNIRPSRNQQARTSFALRPPNPFSPEHR